MSKDTVMIAISMDNTSAFIVNDEKLLLLTPPYLASDQIEVTENDIDKVLQLDQFKECDYKFNNMKEAISFLENRYLDNVKFKRERTHRLSPTIDDVTVCRNRPVCLSQYSFHQDLGLNLTLSRYIEMLKGFGVVEPSTENFKELLKYADEDVYINYLKRTKNELIPKMKFDIAETIASDIMDLNKGNPDIKNMASDILREITKLNWPIKYPNATAKFSQGKIEIHSRQIGEEKRVFNIADKAA